MAAELVNSATNENLPEVDWNKNIEICELVAKDHSQAKDVVKAIKKRLMSKNPTGQLHAVMLLEILMYNIGEHVHQQVIDKEILPILVKIVKKKVMYTPPRFPRKVVVHLAVSKTISKQILFRFPQTDFPVRERIFLLLDAAQTSLGGASGKFPQYYLAYYDLVKAGVQFPERAREVRSRHRASQANKKNTLNAQLAASRREENAEQAKAEVGPDSSIIEKASNVLEVLKEVLDAVDFRSPEGARDEFTLDLVEQCAFQKQRVMHLVVTSCDEKLVSRAIELNEQLQKVLSRHDSLLADGSTPPSWPHVPYSATTINDFRHHKIEEEEEEPEQLFRRLRKGKARANPEDEENLEDVRPDGLLGSPIRNRPIIRPLPAQHSNESSPTTTTTQSSPVALPPPPAKHVERERFFQENKVDGSALAAHMKALSLHSHNASSSHSGSMDFSD